MKPLDALFLHAEDGVSHMHIGSCAVFAGPTPTMSEILSLIASKLPLLSRYRQRARFVPLHLGHPVWIDDVDFQLADHVRHTALPAPGGDDELGQLMGRVMSHELDRSRPLWEAWVVEGLSGDRWALISKVHHCMVDGIAGTDMLASLLDTDPRAEPPVPLAWRPAPPPSDVRLAFDALAEMVAMPARQLLTWGANGLDPASAWHNAGLVVSGVRSLGTTLGHPAKHMSVEGLIGPNRRWSAGRCRLSDVSAIRRVTGGSVNDVVLAAIAGAFRDVLISRGEDVEGVVLRSLVPVSMRAPGDHSANNQVSLLIVDLPVGIDSPLGRLEAVSDRMARLKSGHQATAAAAIVAAADFLPPALLAYGASAMMTVLRRLPQGAVHTVTTNVPGPQVPLYAMGREMLEYLPYVPVSEGIRIGVAIVSYNGAIAFGVTGDYDTTPDVQLMSARIESQLALLRRATEDRSAALAQPERIVIT